MAYRILSLDGGGPWALIEVKALIALYSPTTTGHAVLSDFDMVAANSGGSLVLGGLVQDLPLEKILSYFTDPNKLKTIFSPTKAWSDRALDLIGIGPKYSTIAKLPAIETLIPGVGTQQLSKVASGLGRSGRQPIHLLITAFDYDLLRAVFFRSKVASGTAWGTGAASNDVTLAQAIDASATPPVLYFDYPAQHLPNPARYWDGGVAGCNNPVLAAVTEALVLGVSPTDIAALSLGTANVALPLATGPNPSIYELTQDTPGVVADLKKLAGSILDDPPDAATFVSHVMTGGNTGVPSPAVSRIARMNPLVSPVKAPGGAWSAPKGMSPGQFTFLKQIPMDAMDPAELQAIGQFADLWLKGNAPNQPIRMDGQTLAVEIGYATFGEALAAWNVIK